jgi:hypothetical protein
MNLSFALTFSWFIFLGSINIVFAWGLIGLVDCYCEIAWEPLQRSTDDFPYFLNYAITVWVSNKNIYQTSYLFINKILVINQISIIYNVFNSQFWRHFFSTSSFTSKQRWTYITYVSMFFRYFLTHENYFCFFIVGDFNEENIKSISHCSFMSYNSLLF